MSQFVYIAGPFFSEADRLFLESLVAKLAASSGLDPLRHFFLPHRDRGELSANPTLQEVFALDIRHLEAAQVVVTYLDGIDADSGTCVELGYAHARGKKVFGISTDLRVGQSGLELRHLNLMVWGACAGGRTLFHNIDDLAAAFTLHIRQSRPAD